MATRKCIAVIGANGELVPVGKGSKMRRVFKSCPYCQVFRRTNAGLREHIEQMHPGLISPSGLLLLPSSAKSPMQLDISQEQNKRKGYNS